MHCPTCREDNAPTTRFCTSCGAVLVEEAPGGGRRRVLRPWGLRSNAPPTISPDTLESSANWLAPEPLARAPHFDLWIASGVVVIVAAVVALNPWGPSDATARQVSIAVAPAPVPPLVQEAALASPALVEPLPTSAPRAHVVAPPLPATAPGPRPLARGMPTVPVVYSVPNRDVLVGDGQEVEVVAAVSAPVAPAPVAAPDRWQALRDILARCQPLGLLDRAMCEQGARLAHCEGYWGDVAQCPAGRTEYGQ